MKKSSWEIECVGDDIRGFLIPGYTESQLGNLAVARWYTSEKLVGEPGERARLGKRMRLLLNCKINIIESVMRTGNFEEVHKEIRFNGLEMRLLQIAFLKQGHNYTLGSNIENEHFILTSKKTSKIGYVGRRIPAYAGKN